MINLPDHPYPDESNNILYHLIFCDLPDLYRQQSKEPPAHPFEILFNPDPSSAALQQLIDDPSSDPRIQILACRRLQALGIPQAKKVLLGVVIEVHLEDGLDVLASFHDGTARFIHHTGRVIIWENTNDRRGLEITRDLFDHSFQIVQKIGPWDKPRRPHPAPGNLRISFLVSDGLYFGEGPINTLFSDPMAGPALAAATTLMQFLTSMTTTT